MISDLITKNKSHKSTIVVIGDSMLDEYFYVKVTRVSPEFPVQVMHSHNSFPDETSPGGAANVCHQMKHFNTNCYLLSPLDKQATNILSKFSFDCGYSVLLESGHIPIKRRFYDGDFPLPRWDIESDGYGAVNIDNIRSQILTNLKKVIRNRVVNAVILSDYGKGLFENGLSNQIINECNSNNIKTIVDPKDTDISKWVGCTVFKPNVGYVKDAYKRYDIASKDLGYLKTKLDCKSIVVTDSGNGVQVYHDDKEQWITSSKKPHVKSVIGAGDCFCAVLSLSLSHNIPLENSVKIAFDAGSVYVEAKHNAPITPYQLSRWDDPVKCKIVTIEEMKEIKKTFPKRTWVWSNGCYDILHTGHLSTFSFAKGLGDKLIVGLNTDESVKRLKGESRPYNCYEDRAMQLASLMYVDFIVPIIDDTPHYVLEQLQPDKIAKGSDYQIDQVCGVDIVGRNNVYLAPFVEGKSTTKLAALIAGGK